MGWYKTDWIDLMGTDASKWSVGAGSTRTGIINCEQFFKLSIKIVIIFKSTSNNNVEVGIYNKDIGGSNELDSLPLWNQRIIEYAGAERRITIPNLDVSSLDGISVIIKNNDTITTINTWVSYKAAINT